MNSFRSAFGAGFTIPAVVISLFALIFAAAGCEVQDLGTTESSAPVQGEMSFSASSQSSVPANPPAWNPDTLYNRAGMYVSHKGKVWVSQWYITRGREPGANTWNGWNETGPVIDPIPAAKPTWAAVSARGSYTLAINSRGELYAWGWNHNGKLGDGTTEQRNSPVRIGIADNWTQAAAGNGYSLALNRSGELFSWGKNFDFGEAPVPTPTRVGTASDWARIGAGHSSYFAIKTNGDLYAWGSDSYGQLGNGDIRGTQSAPALIDGDSDWTHVSGWRHTLARGAGGELYAWGLNDKGQLGDGTTAQGLLPVKIAHP